MIICVLQKLTSDVAFSEISNLSVKNNWTKKDNDESKIVFGGVFYCHRNSWSFIVNLRTVIVYNQNISIVRTIHFRKYSMWCELFVFSTAFIYHSV